MSINSDKLFTVSEKMRVKSIPLTFIISDRCPEGEFRCPYSCISSWWLCDGEPDCYDGVDEEDCKGKFRIFMISLLARNWCITLMIIYDDSRSQRSKR